MRGPLIKEQKRERALLRKDMREARTPRQQLDFLDAKLGKGKGARKERTELAKQIKENA